MQAPLIFVGYDAREHEAWEVCRDSILRRSSVDVRIAKLEEPVLREAGLYRRAWHAENGQRIDNLDKRPFSTDFSFTRFLAPALALYQGWALYCDCDFLFTADIAGLFVLADERYAAMCVKHKHVPTEATKMDGVEQTKYRRKNWSSLTLWNAAHPANRNVLTVDCVNKMPGQWLHAFEWLKDDEIGELPVTWNWLAGVSAPLERVPPCGIHYTLGVPSMPGYEDCVYAEFWRTEQRSRRAIGAGPMPTERLRAVGE